MEAGLLEIWRRKEVEFFEYYGVGEFECWEDWASKGSSGPIWEAPTDCDYDYNEAAADHRVPGQAKGKGHSRHLVHPSVDEGGDKKRPLDLTTLLGSFNLLGYGFGVSATFLGIEFIFALWQFCHGPEDGPGNQFMQTGTCSLHQMFLECLLQSVDNQKSEDVGC